MLYHKKEVNLNEKLLVDLMRNLIKYMGWFEQFSVFWKPAAITANIESIVLQMQLPDKLAEPVWIYDF